MLSIAINAHAFNKLRMLGYGMEEVIGSIPIKSTNQPNNLLVNLARLPVTWNGDDRMTAFRNGAQPLS